MFHQTPSQTVGPFFHIGLIHGEDNNLVQEETRGERIVIRGVVRDGDGQPINDAMIEIWQADAQGIYPHPADPRRAQADPAFAGFGRAATDNAGIFTFHTIRPGPVPYDEQRLQAPHILVRLFMRGMLIHAFTRLYFSDEPANDNDPVLQAIDPTLRPRLIARREDRGGQPTYVFDIWTQGEQALPFFEP